MDVTPGIRRDPLPDLDAVGQDDALVARIRDEIERDGPDHVRPVHGPRAVRPRRRLLPRCSGPSRPRRRFPDRTRVAPDLRGGSRSGGRRRVGPARPARPVRAPRIRRGDRDARARDPRRPGARASGSRATSCATTRSRSSHAGSRRSRRRLEAAGHAGALAGTAESTPNGRSSASSSPMRSSTPCRPTASCNAAVPCARSRSAGTAARSSTSRPTRRRPHWPHASKPSTSTLADGQRAEICLALDGWIAAAAAGLGRGVLLLIDYGHPARRALRPGPASRRHAPGIPAPPRPRRPVHPRRAPGPDRPRRRHRRRARGDAARASTHLGHDDPGGVPRRARHGGSAPGDPGRSGDDHRGLPGCPLGAAPVSWTRRRWAGSG